MIKNAFCSIYPGSRKQHYPSVEAVIFSIQIRIPFPRFRESKFVGRLDKTKTSKLSKENKNFHKIQTYNSSSFSLLFKASFAKHSGNFCRLNVTERNKKRSKILKQNLGQVQILKEQAKI